MTTLDVVKIGGKKWGVRVLSIEENFNILDTDNAGRVIQEGAMTLDRIGTFYGHKVTFARSTATIDEYDKLFNYLAYPRNDGIQIEIVHDQTTINYRAYIASGSRKLQKIESDGTVYWDSMSISFVPMKAQVTP